MQSALLLKDISKSFGNLEVLRDIRLNIHPGQFVSLIGPSGCGKSTLLRLLAGIEEVTFGSISLDGKRVTNAKGKVGYMPQAPSLLPWRTVEENVILGLDIKSVSRKIALQKARKLLSEFGLSEFSRVYPSVLSGGMAQKVALLRTILFNNSLLLLDEPFGALDGLTRLSLQFWLLDLWQKHRSTALFVTHDIREAILLSDRVLVMSERPGKIIADLPINLPRPRKREHLIRNSALQIEQELFNFLISK